jgi:hypothetical protein
MIDIIVIMITLLFIVSVHIIFIQSCSNELFLKISKPNISRIPIKACVAVFAPALVVSSAFLLLSLALHCVMSHVKSLS